MLLPDVVRCKGSLLFKSSAAKYQSSRPPCLETVTLLDLVLKLSDGFARANDNLVGPANVGSDDCESVQYSLIDAWGDVDNYRSALLYLLQDLNHPELLGAVPCSAWRLVLACWKW